MYLKSIDVNGFKSFANKIEFKFEEGITAIVGPNGSGKSNVADAVRWVLGEQSASKLRGSKMEDVIFSGTEQRKPMAAAYVAITLDNSDHSLPIDYNEVTVARRVYRSGESEYLINGTVTRLKDITSMFFDTGIGKEGYSIIGQGQIERILSDKPDDRRALFDEAAGIVKYKKNKQITEKQLEAEHANLNRVTDIISTLEDRVEPLRKQSEKAKEYLAYKDELKSLDINSFLLNIDIIRSNIDEYQKKLDLTEEEAQKLRDELEYTKAEYERLESTLEKLSNNIEDCKADIGAKQIENERTDGELRVVQERISAEDIRCSEINAQIEKYKAEEDELKDQLKDLDAKKKEIAVDLKAKKKVINEIEKRQEEQHNTISEIESSISQAQSDIVEALSESSNVKEKIARYDTMLENVNLRKTELSSKYLEDKSEEDRCLSEQKTLNVQLESIESDLKKERTSLNNVETELRTVSERSNLVKNDIQKYNQSIISLQSRYESLRNLTERYEGYGGSIKKVMERKTSNKKIIGVVADIIEVDKKYETAIETSLGASIQNIVTEDEATAKEMISYLRTNKLGRATFLPITSIVKRGSANPDALKEEGVIGVASQLVKTDKKYKGIIDSLLGRSIVVDNIDNAIRLARKYNQSLRLVTPAGDLINPGGAMTGGAFKNSSNLLGRKRELEDISKEIGEINNSLRKAREEDANLTMKKESLKENRTNLTNSIQQKAIEQNSLQISLKNISDKLEIISGDLNSIQKENSELDIQTKQISDNKTALFDTDKLHEGVKKDKEKLITSLEKDLAENRDKLRDIEDELAHENLEYSYVEQSVSYLDIDIDRINGETEKVRAEISDARSRLSENSNSVKAMQKQISDMEKLKINNEKDIEKLKEDLVAYIDEKDDINKKNKDFFNKREELLSNINGLEKASYTIKLDLEKQEEERDKLSNYMWEEYELTYSSAEALRSEEKYEKNELKKMIAAVRQKIRQLGDVNVSAIEEYKEVSERYEFLKTQRDDIVEAENNLRGIIADLDKAMTETFSEKFKEIQDMFSKVFKELFGGGKASLTLVDEENILETGVIINAQPPGKKLQNMMQLSGGEKSLTAISLLFAIQSLKPSPFCILDEIEAALDDSNVGRFAHYLQKLTKHTQFIVITHRKGTMEEADILYGITMQEKGVSTLVSVNLIEDKLTN